MASPLRTHHGDFDPVSLAAGRDRSVAVCLPARDEAATVGDIVTRIRTELQDAVDLVDELVVVDDHSEDGTGAVARAAGATVIEMASVAADPDPGPGKGAALWTSLHETTSDIVVWIDADLERFDTGFVTGLVGTLLEHPTIGFAKGSYGRPLVDGDGGGRVTELLARPTIANLFPELGGFRQPLSGEYGGRRALLETLPFVQGYGVDLALLVDAWRAVGLDGMADVALGVRRHRNRPLDQLGPQATEVLRAALVRAGAIDDTHAAVLRRPGTEALLVAHRELPPLVESSSYRWTA